MSQLPGIACRAFAVYFIIALGVASPYALGSPAQAPIWNGVPITANPRGQGVGGFFYQAVITPSGYSPSAAPSSSNGGGFQAGVPSEVEAQIGTAGDVYYLREGGAYAFFTPQLASPVQTQSLLAQVLEVLNDPAKKRSRFRIYVEILDLLKEHSLNPFEVAFRLRLNAKRTRRYLELLQERGMLERVVDGSKIRYKVSSEGVALLEYAQRALRLDR